MATITGTNDPFLNGVALEEAQDAAHLDVNLNALDMAVFFGGKLADDTLTAPPVSPTTGAGFYIPQLTATGAWAGHEGDATYWDGNEWRFLASSARLLAINQVSNNLSIVVPGTGDTVLSHFYETSHWGTINATTSFYIYTSDNVPASAKIFNVDTLVSTTTTSDATDHWTFQVTDLNSSLTLLSSPFDSNGADWGADSWNTLAVIDQNNTSVFGPLELVLTKNAAADDLTRFAIRVVYEWSA